MIEHYRHNARRTLRRRLATARGRCASNLALAALVASLVALPAGTGAAIARVHEGPGPQTGNTSAVAVNTTDDSLMFKLSFAIFTVTGNVVDNQNVADAFASCDRCRTVAISIQTLLVESAASVVAPINEASSRNQNCTDCDTVAIAYQFVVAAGTKLELSPRGRREVAYIRRQLERLRQAAARRGMTGEEIVAAVATLMKQYAGILSTELVPASHPGTANHAFGEAPSAPVTPSSPGQDPALAAQTTPSAADSGASTTTNTPPASASASSGTSQASTATLAATPDATTPTTTTTTASTPADPGTTPTTTTGTTPTTTTTSGVTTTTTTPASPTSTTAP